MNIKLHILNITNPQRGEVSFSILETKKYKLPQHEQGRKNTLLTHDLGSDWTKEMCTGLLLPPSWELYFIQVFAAAGWEPWKMNI